MREDCQLVLLPGEQFIWSEESVAFLYVSASFSHKYHVRDTILQTNEKRKVQHLRSLLFDLLEILQAVET